MFGDDIVGSVVRQIAVGHDWQLQRLAHSSSNGPAYATGERLNTPPVTTEQVGQTYMLGARALRM